MVIIYSNFTRQGDKISLSRLKNYIEFSSLMHDKKLNKEENRLDGLKISSLKNKPVKQLQAWTKLHADDHISPHISSNVINGIRAISYISIVLFLFFGIATGYGLINYNGQNPINVLHFLSIGVLLPTFTLFLTIVAMIRSKNKKESFLLHISPAFLIDKLLEIFPVFKIKFKIKPLIMNWLIITRAQYLSIAFLSGLLLALVFNVVSQDLAFGWSTTLDIDAKSFYDFIQLISAPWSWFFHSAVPSLELVQKSQYYRLGGELTKEYISHAKLLGGWWQFLFFTILFIGILPRILVLFISNYFLSKSIDDAYLDLKNSGLLLKNMNEPLVTTGANDEESDFNAQSSTKEIKKAKIENNQTIIGWGIYESELELILDSKDVKSPTIFIAGGNNTLEDDQEVINFVKGDYIVIVVKAWEPPVIDFTDFIDELEAKVKNIDLLLVGLVEDAYRPKRQDIEIWSRKLEKYQNIRIII